jgi:hypothetical protein
MDEYNAKMQAAQQLTYNQASGALQGALGNLISAPQSMTTAEVDRQDAIHQQYAARSLRQEALRIALEMARGTDRATDWDDIVTAARVFLAFIENG